MSNLLNKFSEKISGHEHNENDNDQRGTRQSNQKQQGSLNNRSGNRNELNDDYNTSAGGFGNQGYAGRNSGRTQQDSNYTGNAMNDADEADDDDQFGQYGVSSSRQTRSQTTSHQKTGPYDMDEDDSDLTGTTQDAYNSAPAQRGIGKGHQYMSDNM
ncbi:Gre1p SCDLUD_001135 [Saccharomycodes ludwigii]|uniref:Gre1p n=1 Tax=Saccharomycodes ludwigii TaxID=36035 RepID=UPI001E8763D2|nr:hypothetical protein SCDLUD_001135 [Saccharomycodes ludwigii]KAH3903495.1 hypothetical protein SCDLUD_001135 [Saccharomycodes ludwigii]